jgi:uncharacterized membrane protein YkoI
MKKRAIVFTAAAAGAAIVLGGSTLAIAGSGGEQDEADGAALTGSVLAQASSAALDAVGSGKVTQTETGSDHGGAYEVEVTLADGSQVDVELDSSFHVLRQNADSENADEQSGSQTGSQSDGDGETADDGSSQ